MLKLALKLSQYISTILLISTGYHHYAFLISKLTTRKSFCKKANCFAELSEAVEESKTTDVIESSSITVDNDTKVSDNGSDLKEAFEAFQSKTNAQFCNVEYSFHQLTKSITALHDSLAELNSRQTKSHQDGDRNSDVTSERKDDEEIDIEDTDDPNDIYSYVQATTPKTMGTSHHLPSGFTTPDQTVPQVNPGIHKFWKDICDDNLEPHRFQGLIKDIVLQDDSMYGLRHFDNRIQHAMRTSFKKHVDILPPFGKLATIPSITNLLVPLNPEYVGYTTIRIIHEWFSDSLSNILFDNNVISPKRTPRAHHILVTHSNTENRWDLLFILLSKRCPFLGGKTLDFASEITLLYLNNEDNHC